MILDTSVVVHWFVPTEFSIAAMRFRNRRDLAAPAVILVETAHVLYKHSRRGTIDPRQCGRSIQILEHLLVDAVPDGNLLQLALEMALTYKHPLYDCLYVALALDRNEPLVTADQGMAALATTLGLYATLIQPT